MFLQELVDNYVLSDFSRFHVPGHKGFFEYDLTELDCTDDLFNSSGPIKNDEILLSSFYGSKCSAFSTSGSTLCIQSMIYIAVPFRGKMIVPRNVHKSVVYIMSLLEIDPIWIPVEFGKNVDPWLIREALRNNSDVDAVLVTSPDYFGYMADIKRIKLFCGKIPLLVDNAHGSHLIFFDKHPLNFGADLCSDSAHKTLPVLTGGAWIHVGKNFDCSYEKLKDSMKVFASSSPSFLTLLSIEKCISWMKEEGVCKFQNLKKNVDKLRKYPFFDCSVQDPVRITFNVGESAGYFEKRLADFKIKPEFVLKGKIVLIPSPFNSERDWDRLRHALSTLDQTVFNENYKCEYNNHKKILKMHQALRFPAKYVSVCESLNKVSSDVVYKCPPGTVEIVPGELISEQDIDKFKQIGIDKVKIVDYSL